MTVGFKETEEEALARLRDEDLYKNKTLLPALLSRLREQDSVLLECAKALAETSPELSERAMLMAGVDPHKQPESRKPLKAGDKVDYSIIQFGDQWLVYRLTYDVSLNKSMPCGHEFIGRYGSVEEAEDKVPASKTLNVRTEALVES